MAVKIIEENQKKKVNMLKDVDVSFVSLVKHGANRMPFRVVKDDKQRGGEKKTMTLAIQSIILPKGTSIDDLTKVNGLEYLSEANLSQKQEFEDYEKFPQIDPKLFDSESMQILKAGDGFLIVGLVNDTEKSDKVLSISEEQVEKLSTIPTAPMDAVIGDPDVAAQQAMVSSFRQMFDTEVYSMLDIVTGLLRQTSGDPKKRKNSIIAAVDAFRNFLSVGLDAIGGESAKVAKVEKVSPDGDQTSGGDEMFKTQEEFTNAVNEIVNKALDDKLPDMVGGAVTSALEKFEEKLDAKFKVADQTGDDDSSGDADAQDQSGDDSNKSDKTDEVSTLKNEIKTLTEKVEKLTNEPDTDSGAADQDDPGDAANNKNKNDDEDKKLVGRTYKGKTREHDMSVFGGLLTHRKKNQAA